MSLLTIIQSASKQLGLNNPASAYASTDSNVVQLVALAQEEGTELMRRHPWTVLINEKTFTSTAAAAQSSALSSDFDRFIDESFFNRTKKRPVFGPISPQEWQHVQASASNTVIEYYRQRGGSILITPTPNGTDTYAYEYIQNTWCQSNVSAEQTAWAADTDTGILDENLMTLGIIWRFLRAKGMDYAEAMRTYEIQVADKFLRDGGKRRLNFGARHDYGRARIPFVPEGSWSL